VESENTLLRKLEVKEKKREKARRKKKSWEKRLKNCFYLPPRKPVEEV